MTPAATKTTTTATPESGRRLWSATEDEILTKAVAEHGAKEWEKIAATVGTRKDWQCRERWHNHLKPGVCKKPWTAWEDQLLEAQVRELGTSWATIAQTFPGRPTTSVKNRWHQLQRKNNRRQNSPSTVASPFTSPLSERASFGAGAGTLAANPATPSSSAPLDTYWSNLNMALHALSAANAATSSPAPLSPVEQAAAAQQLVVSSSVPQLPHLLASYNVMLASALANTCLSSPAAVGQAQLLESAAAPRKQPLVATADCAAAVAEIPSLPALGTSAPVTDVDLLELVDSVFADLSGSDELFAAVDHASQHQ